MSGDISNHSTSTAVPARAVETDRARRLAERYRLDFLDMNEFRIDQELFRSIPADLMLRYGFVPSKREGKSIVIVNHNDRQRATARGLWSSMVNRVAALAAGRVERLVIDTTGAGADHRLFTTVVSGVEVPRALDSLSREAPPEGGRVIAIPDVPLGLGPRDAALVLAMIREGVAGATLAVHLDADLYRSEIGEPDLGVSSLRWLVDVAPPTVADPSAGLSVIWDAAPPPALVDLIVDRLASG